MFEFDGLDGVAAEEGVDVVEQLRCAVQGDGGEGLFDGEGEGCVVGGKRDVGGFCMFEEVFGSDSYPVVLDCRKDFFCGLPATDLCGELCGEASDGVGLAVSMANGRTRRVMRRGTSRRTRGRTI